MQHKKFITTPDGKYTFNADHISYFDAEFVAFKGAEPEIKLVLINNEAFYFKKTPENIKWFSTLPNVLNGDE